MADKKIGAMTSSVAAGTDEVAINRGDSQDRKVTAQSIANLAGSNIAYSDPIIIPANRFVPDVTEPFAAGTFQETTAQFGHADFLEFADGATDYGYVHNGFWLPPNLLTTAPIRWFYTWTSPNTNSSLFTQFQLSARPFQNGDDIDSAVVFVDTIQDGNNAQANAVQFSDPGDLATMATPGRMVSLRLERSDTGADNLTDVVRILSVVCQIPLDITIAGVL